MYILSHISNTRNLTYGYVYMWTNVINGKQYIGSTAGKDLNYITNGKAIQIAMAKYGLDNFKRDILYVGPRYYEVETEMLITIDAARSRNNWYNQTNNMKFGGQPVFSDEVREGMSVTRKQMFEEMTDQGILHPWLDTAGEKNPFYGKKHTAETCESMSSSQVLRNHGLGNHQFPKEGCPACPVVSEDEMIELFAQACLRVLATESMMAKPLKHAIQAYNYPASYVRAALTLLITEGKVEKVRGRGYVMCDESSL